MARSAAQSITNTTLSQPSLLTHSHTDHVVDLPRLAQGVGSPPVWINSLESGDEDFPTGVRTFEAGRTFQVGGLTIDYGPCAFMDDFVPMKTFSSIDRQGRYAYGNQPNLVYWFQLLHRKTNNIISI